MKISIFFIVLTGIYVLSSCKWFIKPPAPKDPSFNNVFDKQPTIADLDPALYEASGIADSRNIAQHIWVSENGQTQDAIYLYDYNGKRKWRIDIPFKNYDWEDMAVADGPIPDQKYVYIADIGDNFKNRPTCNIVRFQEPKTIGTQVVGFENIIYKYPNGEFYDAEAMIVDPKTKDIYIFTKELSTSQIFKLPYPQVVGQVQTAQFVKSIAFPVVTSAGISNDSKEVVLKNYAFIYYWNPAVTDPIETTVSKSPTKYLPYEAEPQGEAFSFTHDGKSYFTLSEYEKGKTVILKRYDRSIKTTN